MSVEFRVMGNYNAMAYIDILEDSVLSTLWQQCGEELHTGVHIYMAIYCTYTTLSLEKNEERFNM